jgi:hypothetical protein
VQSVELRLKTADEAAAGTVGGESLVLPATQVELQQKSVPTSGGSNNPHCRYCDGEGYMWSERIIKICFFRGVAPVYKPGNLATGQYPQADTGYLASDRATVFCEYSVFPNYERYTNDEQARYDMLYELKVAASGRTVSPLVRTAKWEILTE